MRATHGVFPVGDAVRESKIENYLKKRVTDAGGLAFKFTSSVNGVPDQLLVHDGRLTLVEVKRPGEKPRANQVSLHAKIEARGVPVYTVDTYDAVDALCRDVLCLQDVPKTVTPKDVTITSFLPPSE